MTASFAGFRHLQFSSVLKRIMNDSDCLLSRAFQILPPYAILWHKEHTAKFKTLVFFLLKKSSSIPDGCSKKTHSKTQLETAEEGQGEN